MAQCTQVSVEIGHDVHSLVLPPAEWNAIVAGEARRICGCGFWYEGDYFIDDWWFNGGVDGDLRITYDKADGNGDDFVERNIGTVRDAWIDQVEDTTWDAYLRTVFEVDSPQQDKPIKIRIDEESAELDELLRSNDAKSWVFITAWNPDSDLRSRSENDQRNQRLRAKLVANALQVFSGRGLGEDERWEPEESFFVPGASIRFGVELGREFGQAAIAAGYAGEPARLLAC